MSREQFEQPRVGGLHLGFLGLARLALTIVEVVDVHVVMVQRPARGLSLGKVGIAVGGMQPGTADVEGHAEMPFAGPGAAADTVHRFEQLEGKAGRPKRLCRGKSRRAGANDHDINVFHG